FSFEQSRSSFREREFSGGSRPGVNEGSVLLLGGKPRVHLPTERGVQGQLHGLPRSDQCGAGRLHADGGVSAGGSDEGRREFGQSVLPEPVQRRLPSSGLRPPAGLV
ncbi:unnamed protein product, partial [Cyprideis torosa]